MGPLHRSDTVAAPEADLVGVSSPAPMAATAGPAPMGATAEGPTPMGDAASATTSADDAAARWRLPLVVLGVVLAGLLGAFAETAWSMVDKWWSVGTYGHGFLIAPVSGYLIWRRRALLAAITPSPCFWGLPLMAVIGLGWLLGDIAGVMVVKQAALVAWICAVALTVLGWQVIRWILFPLGFLFFSVPVGDFLVAPMQDVTAVMSVDLVRRSGVPVFMDGLLIHIPTGSFIVAEACSGVRFMISTLALGFLGAYFFYTSWWRRLLFLGLAIVVPIIANGIRAYLIVMIAHWSDHTMAVGVDHLVYGWVFLSFVTLCLLGLGMTFRQTVEEPGPEAVANDPPRRGSGPARTVAAAAAALLLIATVPVYGSVIESRSLSEQHAGPQAPPKVGGAWMAVDEDDPLEVRLPGLDPTIQQSYADGDRRVQFMTAYVPVQRQGQEVVSQYHSFEQGPWLRVRGGVETIPFAGNDLRVRAVELRRNFEGRLVWFWYWVDGHHTSSPLVAKLLEVKAKLLGGRLDAALIVVAADFVEQPAEATSALAAFVADLGPLEDFFGDPDG